MGEPVEVLRSWIGHDVAVLRPTHNAPRSQCQATYDYKPDIRLDEMTEQLIKKRCAQRARSVASRNSNSLRVSEIVSSRFTASGRCPSARSRTRRTRSPSTSCTWSFGCSAIKPNTTAPVPSIERAERHAIRPPGAYLADGEGGIR